MFSKPERREIDDHTMKLLMGVIAISLASVTSFLSDNEIASISASYHEGGWARDYFVGSLFAIFAFFLGYNGESRKEMIASKVVAFAALGVALFPCHCDIHKEIIRGVHGVSAAVMFGILAGFCYLFRQRARKKDFAEAKLRSYIYLICGAMIVISILVLSIDHLSAGAIKAGVARITFYGEAAGLFAFGVAWLVASRVLPFLTNPAERLNPFA